jgi:hypothetical protein
VISVVFSANRDCVSFLLLESRRMVELEGGRDSTTFSRALGSGYT